MKSRSMQLAVLVMMAGWFAMLSGCVRHEVVYVQGPPPPGAVVYQEAPPPPLVEVVPEPPTIGVVWVQGYWYHDPYHHWAWRRGYYRR